MNKSDTEGMDKEVGDQIRLYVYRVPKKNHDVMLQLSGQFIDMFRKHGCHARSFQLESTESSEGLTSLANAVSASQDDEIWLDRVLQRPQTHE